MDWSSRFKSKTDECAHIIIGLLIADVLEEQKQDLLDNFGNDIFNQALAQVESEYSSLLARF
ncbi:MAG: hypothetical protein J6D47_09330 [Peptostreptococcaceae bacterium]|nr:hypothetical protein [Peptostreptococcaceae bacterium]